MGIRRIILHIGRHKSGTSSLQHFFAAHREFLDRQGVLYPLAGTRKNGLAHHELSHLCHKGRNAAAQLDQIIDALKAEIQPHHETLLFSSEEFQNLASVKEIRYLTGQFRGAEVDIICYVREFADYMVSSFRQAVQNQSKFQTFSTFCNNRYPARGFIRRWRKLGSLKLGWFHPNLLKDNDIVADFLDKAYIAPPGEYTTEQRNPSLGGNLLWMKMAANHAYSMFLPYGDMTRLMLKRDTFIRPFYFSDERANVLRGKSSYNRTFEKILGPVPSKSWEEGVVLPDQHGLKDDLAYIKEIFPHMDLSQLGLEPAKGRDWF